MLHASVLPSCPSLHYFVSSARSAKLTHSQRETNMARSGAPNATYWYVKPGTKQEKQESPPIVRAVRKRDVTQGHSATLIPIGTALFEINENI